MHASELFELPANLPFQEFFAADLTPWQWLPNIARALQALTPNTHTISKGNCVIQGSVFIHPTVQLPAFGFIQGPAYIGANTEIRPGAYIRGNVIVGERCVLGNACEYKNCLLMNDVQTPHYNYVGDSILGSGSHLAAGAILANLRLDQAAVRVRLQSGERIETGLRKLGSMIGEGAQVGCNAVLQPGTMLGKGAVVMPTVAFGGYLPAGHWARIAGETIIQRVNQSA